MEKTGPPARTQRSTSVVSISGIIILLVVGLVVGALARAVLPGRQALPIWLTMVIGVGSLLLGGLLLSSAGLIVRVIVGVIIAAAIIALTQGGLRSRSRV